MKKLLTLLAITLALAACNNEHKVDKEEIKDNIEESMDKMKDKLHEGMDKMKDKMEEIRDTMKVRIDSLKEKF